MISAIASDLDTNYQKKSVPFVIVAGQHGLIKNYFKSMKEQQTSLTFLAKITTDKKLTQLTLPTSRTMLYATEKGKARTIDMFDFVEADDVLRGIDFALSTKEHVVLDQCSQTTAHWTNNQDLEEHNRSIIFVNRITNPKNPTIPDPEEDKIEPDREHYKLSADFQEKSYPIILPNAKSAECKSHFLGVALRKSTVIAIASTGQLFTWKLPPLPIAHGIEENTVLLDTIQTHIRSNSNITTTTTTTITTTPTETPVDSPVSTRGSKYKQYISLQTITHRSRSNSSSPRSPGESPKVSPKQSPTGKQSLHSSDSKSQKKSPRSHIHDSQGNNEGLVLKYQPLIILKF